MCDCPCPADGASGAELSGPSVHVLWTCSREQLSRRRLLTGVKHPYTAVCPYQQLLSRPKPGSLMMHCKQHAEQHSYLHHVWPTLRSVLTQQCLVELLLCKALANRHGNDVWQMVALMAMPLGCAYDALVAAPATAQLAWPITVFTARSGCLLCLPALPATHRRHMRPSKRVCTQSARLS